MRLANALLGLVAACFMIPVQAVIWDMPIANGENSFHTVNIRQFADDVERATNGKLKIKIHSDGSLFEHPEIKSAVRGGRVPIGEFLLSQLSNEDVIFEVDAVPFLASTYEKAGDLWKASKPTIASLLDRQGLVVLFSVPWPPEGLYSKKPLKEIEDLRGLKVRAADTSTAQLARHAGAVPTLVEVPDIPLAFSSGRVEAMITSPSEGANTKAWNFVEYFYHTQAWLPKNIVVVNKQAFGRLDESVQRAVLAAAERAEARGWQASREETSQKLDVLRDHGISVHRPENGLMQALKKIGRKMTHDWTEKAGDDGIRIIQHYYSLY